MSIKHKFIFIVALFSITAINHTAFAMDKDSESISEEYEASMFSREGQENISLLGKTPNKSSIAELTPENLSDEDFENNWLFLAHACFIDKIDYINKNYYNTIRVAFIAFLESNYCYKLIYDQYANYPLLISNILFMPFLMWIASDSNPSMQKFYAVAAMLILNPNNVVFQFLVSVK